MEYQLAPYENDYCSQGMVSDDKKCYSCAFPNCGKIFRYQSEFKRHKLTHISQRHFTCPFTNCRKKFKREDSLKDHIRTHTGEKPYACQEPECGKNFLSKAALRYHMLKHKGEKQYRCSFLGCNKAFLTMTQLKQHEDTQKCHQNISNHLIYGSIQECLNVRKNNESSNDDSFGLDIKVGKELEEKRIRKREFMSIQLSGDYLQVQFSRIAKLILDENNAIKTRLAMHEKLKRLSQENEGMDENLRAFSEAEEHKQFSTQEFSEERIFQFLKFND